MALILSSYHHHSFSVLSKHIRTSVSATDHTHLVTRSDYSVKWRSNPLGVFKLAINTTLEKALIDFFLVITEQTKTNCLHP